MNVRTETLFHEIARLLLLKQSDDEIAQRTGLKVTSVKTILQKKEFREIVEQLRANAYRPIDEHLESESRTLTQRIKDDASESYDRLLQLLRTSPSEAIQRDIAMDLLDRAGYGKKSDTPAPTITIGVLETAVLVEALKKEREAREQYVLDPAKVAKPIEEGLSGIHRGSNQGEGSTAAPQS